MPPAADVLAACREREEVKELRRISIDPPARMRAVLSALAREPKRFTDLLAHQEESARLRRHPAGGVGTSQEGQGQGAPEPALRGH